MREPHEDVIAHIDGAFLIPLGELPARLNEVPRDQKIVVHCKLGGRSAKAAAHLLANGFADVWNVAGGITAWSKEVDPSIPTD